MFCNDCNGILLVINIHQSKNDRLCDVQCVKCHKIIYYQPYDNGQKLNLIKGNKI